MATSAGDRAAASLARLAVLCLRRPVVLPERIPSSSLRCLSSTPALHLQASRPRRSKKVNQARRAQAQTVSSRLNASPRYEKNVAVIGGGLTGLTAAYYLAKQLPSTVGITLYEAQDRLGGWIRTESMSVASAVGGGEAEVSVELGARTLPRLGALNKFDDMVLFDLMLDLGIRPQGTQRLDRFVYYPDRLVGVPPRSFAEYLDPLYLSLIPAVAGWSLKPYFSSLHRSLAEARQQDLSISDFCHQITGTRIGWEHPVSAVIHGIYGGDIDKLSAYSVFEKTMHKQYLYPKPPKSMFMAYESEMKLWNKFSKDKQLLALRNSSVAIGSVATLGPGGMSTLTEGLASALQTQPNVTIKKGTPVRSLVHKRHLGQIEVMPSGSGMSKDFDKVIATVPGPVVSKMTSNLLPSLSLIPSISMWIVTLFYPDPEVKPRGLGYLIPRTISKELNPHGALGVFFDSDVGVANADEGDLGGTKVTVMLGGHYYGTRMEAPKTNEEAIEQAKETLALQLMIPKDFPGVVAMAKFQKDCIAQHHVGHHKLLAKAHRDIKQHFGGRLAVAGGPYTRNGVVAAMVAGHNVADELAQGDWTDTGLGRPWWPDLQMHDTGKIIRATMEAMLANQDWSKVPVVRGRIIG